jgi:pyrroloquinoline quinone biosynthesis protein B
MRGTPIGGVMLTNADLDHALGLLLLRQNDERLIVCASAQTRGKLRWTEPVLSPFAGVSWRQPPSEFFQLTSGLEFRAITVTEDSTAYEFRNQNTGKRFVLAPSVPELSAELQTALNWCDAILLDGTFWSNDELKAVRPAARSAVEMGHLPIQHTVSALRNCRAMLKVYSHINNTNPILAPESPERGEVESAGITIGEDGMEFEI